MIFSKVYFLSITLRIIFILLSFIISIATFIFFKLNKNGLFKIGFVINIIFVLLFSLYSHLYLFDLIKYISSTSVIKEFILSCGMLGVLIYIFIQIAQVVFLPIPAVVILLVGILIYGPLITTLLCSIGVIIGSLISFGIGKWFGKKFTYWFFGKEKTEKYLKKLNNNGIFVLAIAFIFPFFPDDLMCMLAGITEIKFKEFSKVCILTRPIGIIVMCYFGGGLITPFNFWGLIFWVFIAIILIIGVLIYFRKQPIIKSLFHKKKHLNNI